MVREIHSLFLLFLCQICNFLSNVYYASIGSETLRFDRTASDMNTFVTLPNRLLKTMQKQQNKHRSIISRLSKIFDKNSTVCNVFADITANFIKLFSLPWISTTHTDVCLLHSLLLLFVFYACLFVCLLNCLFVWLSCYYCFSLIYLCFYVFTLICVPMGWHSALQFYYNFSII